MHQNVPNSVLNSKNLGVIPPKPHPLGTVRMEGREREGIGRKGREGRGGQKG